MRDATERRRTVARQLSTETSASRALLDHDEFSIPVVLLVDALSRARKVWNEGEDVEKSGRGENPVSAFQRAAKTLLAGRPGDSNTSKDVAARAVQAFETLAEHLVRLLGEMGVKMLLERSIAVAASQFPWLRASPSSAEHPESRTSVLGHAMEKQEPGLITEAFVEVLSIFAGLLKRLIGDGLVDALLDEVWPGVFVHAVEDTP